MDPKKQGIVFEALTCLALRSLSHEVHWGEKPIGFSIDPDFILGSLSGPTHWILVTSTGSAKEFDKKFWRNVAEICEAHTHYTKPPRIINLVFKLQQKVSLQDAMTVLSDADLRVLTRPYGNALVAFIDSLPTSFPADNNEKVSLLEARLAKDQAGQSAFDEFKVDLKSKLQITRPSLEQLWSSRVASGVVNSTRKAKQTSLRRGLAKLLVVEESLRAAMVENVTTRKKLPKDLPPYIPSLGYVTRSIGGWIVSDPELQWLANNLDFATIKSVIAACPESSMLRWIEPLRDLSRIHEYHQFVVNHYSELITEKGMLKHLKAQHADPNSGIDASRIVHSLRSVWLFDFIGAIVKGKTKKSQAFGYSFFASRDDANSFTIGSMPVGTWCSCFSNRFFNRDPGFVADAQALKFIARSLSAKLREYGLSDIGDAMSEVTKMDVRANLEQRLIPYRMFEPLAGLLEKGLASKDISYRRLNTFPSCIGEVCEKPKRIATTPVILSGSTLIHWKSASLNPRDKTKELCGRVHAMRVQYASGAFSTRKGIKKALLLLDGAFTDKQLASLNQAGWDEIYYPDEIEKLVAAII